MSEDGEFTPDGERRLTQEDIDFIMNNKELRKKVMKIIIHGKYLDEIEREKLYRILNVKNEEEFENKLKEMTIIGLLVLINTVSYRKLLSDINCYLRHEKTPFGDTLFWIECGVVAEGEKGENLRLPPETIPYITPSGNRYQAHVRTDVPEGETVVESNKIVFSVTVEPTT